MGRILDRFAQPFASDAEAPPGNGHANGHANGRGNASKKGAMDALLVSLANMAGMPPSFRARDPMKNHAWSFVAAFAIAKAAPPFGVFQETDAHVERRRVKAASRGDRLWNPPRGNRRTAVERWLRMEPRRLAAWKTWQHKAFDLDPEHPLSLLFRRPNPVHGSRQFWMVTLMALATKGDARWVLRGPDFSPLGLTSQPAEIWPTTASGMRAIQAGGTGEVIAWEWTIPNGAPGGGGGRKLRLLPHEVIRFHFADPENLLDAIAPVAAAAAAIERDMLADTANRDLIQNGCNPRGVVMSDLPMDADVEKEFRSKWEERHSTKDGGAGRTAFLYGGTKYLPTGLTPDEMGFKDMYELDRIATLAAFGTMPSAVGLAEGANYATDLAQRLNFYDRTVLPMLGLIEETLDGTIFEQEKDTIFGMFDRSAIEALRAGTAEKATTANVLAGQALHVPPKLAFRMVGLDVEEDYAGDDVALVPPALAPAEVVASGELVPDPNAPPPPGAPGAPDPAKPGESPTAPTGVGEGGAKDPDPAAGGAGDDETKRTDVGAVIFRSCASGAPRLAWSSVRSILAHGLHLDADAAQARMILEAKAASPWSKLRGAARLKAARNRHQEFIDELQGPLEVRVSKDYRAWVRETREETLKRFDRAAKGLTRAVVAAILKDSEDGKVELAAVLPDLGETKSSLKATTRPTFSDSLEAIYDFTLPDVGGMAVFEVDDRRIVNYFDARHDRFTGMTTQRLIDRVRESLTQGMSKGETVQELRLRIGSTYDLAASSAKTLQVARTETAGFANGMRDEMFVADGWNAVTWDSADDEHVRDSHVIYGNAGPQPIGFNFMSLVGGTDGFLGYPGDSRAPAREVVNCRCFHLPES